MGRCLESVFSKTRPRLSYPAGRTNILWTTFTGRDRTSGAAGWRQAGWRGGGGGRACLLVWAGEGRELASTSISLRCLCLAAAASLQLSFQLHCIQKILVQITAYTGLDLFQKFALKMASEIRIGGNKYQLSTSSGGGQYYYIQTESPETSVQQTNGEVSPSPFCL